MVLSDKEISSFQLMIFDWWEIHRRDLPWRHTRNPYYILVSELMLQQTQVSRVLPTYLAFIQQFPTPTSLAQASLSDVLKAWKGMGYNRRAKYLQQAAQTIATTYKGLVPKEQSVLQTLPGIGPYTASAICVFAYEQDVVVIDTNIRQIFEHFFFSGETQTMSVLHNIGGQLLPKGNSWSWHQALMDYGSLALPPKEKQQRKKQQSIPFPQTDRYFRGKIIDMLRDGSASYVDLEHALLSLPHASKERTKKIITTLISEGLIQSSKHILSLPE